MKKFIFIIGALFLLSACGSEPEQITQVNNSRKPSIPKAAAQADILEVNQDSDDAQVKDLTQDPEAMDDLIGRINKDLTGQDITEEEIAQGWYYAEEGERKWGTPSSWKWTRHEGGSYWISPDALKVFSASDADELCRASGGYYVISCVESEFPHCEYIPESTCRCDDNTKWLPEQGCILFKETDDEDEWVEISPNELDQGWYAGSRSEKKFNTPANWKWINNADGGRWQNG